MGMREFMIRRVIDSFVLILGTIIFNFFVFFYMIALTVIVVNFIADISYSFLDPRVRFN
ncbi:MAG: hypothetical protein ACFFCF_02250 [Promethearchaeota archaeon]